MLLFTSLKSFKLSLFKKILREEEWKYFLKAFCRSTRCCTLNPCESENVVLFHVVFSFVDSFKLAASFVTELLKNKNHSFVSNKFNKIKSEIILSQIILKKSRATIGMHFVMICQIFKQTFLVIQEISEFPEFSSVLLQIFENYVHTSLRVERS